MLDLHERAQARLIQLLAPALEKVTINHGSFVNAHSLSALDGLDKVLPSNSKTTGELHRYIDDEPAYHFFSERIFMTVGLETNYEEGKSLKLSDVPSFSDLAYAAEHLVSELATLPWKYRVYYPLWGDAAKILPSGQDRFELSPDTQIVRITEANIAEFPQKGDNDKRGLANMFGSLFGHPTDALTLGRVVFVSEIEGFVGRFAVSAPLRSVESRLRAFFGLCLAVGVLENGNAYMPSPPKQLLLVERTDQGVKELERDHELDDDFNRAVAKLEPVNFGGKFEPSVIEEWNAQRLELMRQAYSETTVGRQLQLAARWHFDSIANNGELLSFVQAMVCLEIILGDQSEATEQGVGEAIRNRCAYLIGKSLQDRQKIMEDLRDIYRVRSKIVHTGKDNLSRSERRMMLRLRQLCSLVLTAELEVAASVKS